MAGKVQKGKRSQRSGSQPYTTKRAKSKSVKQEVEDAEPAKHSFTVEYPAGMPSEGDIARGNIISEQDDLIERSEYIKSPFYPRGALPGALDQRVIITPNEAWTRMRKYANFVIQEETYSSEEIVFVRGDHTPPQNGDLQPDKKTFWVAKILQVRASDPQHVYALVAWLYWPHELPPPAKKAPDQISLKGGQRTYHGAFELIASNYLDVLDVLTFAGKANVVEWDEVSDGSEFMAKNLYWRQTLCRGTGALSKCREHCICKSHYNPNVSMFICDNSACAIWFHKVCLTENHLREAFAKLKPELKTDALVVKKNINARKPMYSSILAGELEAAERDVKITIHDLRKSCKKTWIERVKCPVCKQKIAP